MNKSQSYNLNMDYSMSQRYGTEDWHKVDMVNPASYANKFVCVICSTIENPKFVSSPVVRFYKSGSGVGNIRCHDCREANK